MIGELAANTACQSLGHHHAVTIIKLEPRSSYAILAVYPKLLMNYLLFQMQGSVSFLFINPSGTPSDFGFSESPINHSESLYRSTKSISSAHIPVRLENDGGVIQAMHGIGMARPQLLSIPYDVASSPQFKPLNNIPPGLHTK